MIPARFVKIPTDIDKILNRFKPLVLMPLISAQMADNLQISKYRCNCFSIVFSIFTRLQNATEADAS